MLASVRRSNGTCGFPACRFHEDTALRCEKRVTAEWTLVAPVRLSQAPPVSSDDDVRVFRSTANCSTSTPFLVWGSGSSFLSSPAAFPDPLESPRPRSRGFRRASGTMQRSDDWQRIASHFACAYRVAYPHTTGDAVSPPGVTPCSSAPCRPHTPWSEGRMDHAFVAILPTRPNPLFGRPVHQLGSPPSITARSFSASPSDSTSRWTPCPPRPPRPGPARHYPRFWIWRPPSERQWDFNPPEHIAA